MYISLININNARKKSGRDTYKFTNTAYLSWLAKYLNISLLVLLDRWI